MSRSDPFMRQISSALWRYGIAVLSVGAALSLARWRALGLGDAPVSVFLCAVMFSAWYGGVGPGSLAIVLSILAFDYYFVPVLYSFRPARVEIPRLIAFTLSALFVGSLSAAQKRATESLRHARDELKGTVQELERANQALQAESNERKHAEAAFRQAQSDLERVSRVTSMGELTASLAHEVNQPIAAAVTDANTCLRWLTRPEPDLVEARQAASRVVKDATRAAEIISRVRMLFKNVAPQREPVDVNEVIREMVVLLSSEASRYSISVRTELTDGVPKVKGDRVQLQQVVMNLMINAMDAMKNTNGRREIVIHSQRANAEGILVSVSDTGVGLPPQHLGELFNAFFTTKLDGTGLGLSISRSIIESHGGRVWAGDNTPCGAIFTFTLPTKVEAHE
jgi:C4-dicarboxylate-specific signal transduction histidine kinase